jgi:SAM-dependent methyltransferase
MSSLTEFRRFFVGLVYADHNRSAAVRRTLSRLLRELPANGAGLNVGAGHTRVDPRLKNLDIFAGPHIDYVGRAEAIPLADDSFDLVITQEVLEHVADPFKAIQEIHRVLRPGGRLYLQLPFIIGYHPGPTDFWRFTREGMTRMLEIAGLECREIGVAVGAATGFYRCAVEFFAIVLSLPWRGLYLPAKALIAVLLYPLKWLDFLTAFSPQNDRIAGGYYVVAQKVATPSPRGPAVKP